MKNTLKKILVPGLLLLCSVSTASDTIVTPSNQFLRDPGRNLIVVNYDVYLINSIWPNNKSYIILDDSYSFVNPVSNIEVGIGYNVLNASTNVISTLYFTSLPLISISTYNEIVDEPRVFAQFLFVESNQNEIISNVGIEYRGASTQALDKKSYRLEFWEDTTGAITKDVSFLGMRLDDDWNLQSMGNEPLRVRTKTNNELWKLIHQIYYKTAEPTAHNGIKMEYVELFINNEYQGIYCLSERIDRKQLQLKKNNTESIRGELYKGIAWGGSTYTTVIPYDNNYNHWNGFEYRFPEDILDWNNIYNFVDFIVNESDNKFYSNYKTKFDVSSIVDYFILLNLLRATDNTGKNVYVARYDKNSPYFFIPWDLDGTLGMIWDGTMIDISDDILFNGLYERLWNDCSKNGFRDKLYWKWNLLRKNVITQTGLMNMIENNINLLMTNGIYEREKIAWSDFEYDNGEIAYIDQWINKRLSFLDTTFTNCVESDQAYTVNIFPNPAVESVYINLNENHLNVDMNISDITGKIVLNQKINPGMNSVSIKSLNSGLYFIRISDSSQSVHKLIVTK